MEIYKYPTFTTDDILITSNDETVCKANGTTVSLLGAGEATVTIHCGSACADVSFTVNAAKTPYISYDFTPLKGKVGTEATDENKSVVVPNTGAAGSALDLTASAKTKEAIVDNKWQTQISEYNAQNEPLENTIDLTAQAFLYVASNVSEGCSVYINGNNANVMPSILTNISTHKLIIRYGGVEPYGEISLEETPTNKIAVYFDGEKTHLFVNGEKVVSNGSKDYIVTAFKYFNIKGATCIGSFKLFLGDSFTDEEIAEMTQ